MKYLIAIVLMLALPVLAQQPSGPPDPAFLQKALEAVVGQRNAAMDQLAATQATLSKAQQDLAAAKTRIEELEKAQPKVGEK